MGRGVSQLPWPLFVVTFLHLVSRDGSEVLGYCGTPETSHCPLGYFRRPIIARYVQFLNWVKDCHPW